MNPDHQVSALLLLVALIVTVIQALRWLGTRIDARLEQHRAAARCRYPSWHEFNAVAAYVNWSDQVENQCRAEASEAELARVEAYINDRPDRTNR